MPFATIRSAFDSIITELGNTASLYSYSGATKTTDDEGKTTVSDWKTATPIKIIPDEHIEIRKLKLEQGDEVTGDGIFYVGYDVTIAKKDKITFNSLNYSVSEIHPVWAQTLLIAQRIIINRT